MSKMDDDDWYYRYVESENPKIWNKCLELSDLYTEIEEKIAKIRDKADQAKKSLGELGERYPFANSEIIRKAVPFSAFVEIGLLTVDNEGDAIPSSEMILLLDMINSLDIDFEKPKAAHNGSEIYIPEGGLILKFDMVSV